MLLDDFDKATSARFPLLVAVLVIVTFLVLLVVFRAPVLALCAVLLNLVTVGAAVGVLILGFQTDPPPLGGPGYLDAIALSGIFAIIFGLSIDYEVFLISRLRRGPRADRHDRGRNPLQPREDRHDHHRRGRRDGRSSSWPSPSRRSRTRASSASA